MDVMIEQLKQKPDLKSLVNELNQIIQEEDKRREEFYNTIAESDKAEFINGEIIMHSPVKLKHAFASELLLMLMKSYCMKNDLGQVFTEKIMIHLTRNSYEPDIVFFKKKKRHPSHRIRCFFPPPI